MILLEVDLNFCNQITPTTVRYSQSESFNSANTISKQTTISAQREAGYETQNLPNLLRFEIKVWLISKKKLVITKDGKSGEVLQCRYELLTEKSIGLEAVYEPQNCCTRQLQKSRWRCLPTSCFHNTVLNFDFGSWCLLSDWVKFHLGVVWSKAVMIVGDWTTGRTGCCYLFGADWAGPYLFPGDW